MFQFKTFPLHNQGPLWFIVTHPQMLYVKKILREKYTFWRTSHICCLRKKYLSLEKKKLLLEKKIFVAREKIFSARKQKYLIAWEKNTCSPVSLRPKSVLVATQRWEWNRFAKLCLKERPPCRKIAPKRSFSALASKRRPSQNYVHSWYLKLSIGNKELSEIKAWAIIEEENCSESVAWTLSLMT